MQLCCIFSPPHLIYSLFAPSKKCMILFPLLSRSHSVVLIYPAYDQTFSPVQNFTDGTESSGSRGNGCCLIPIKVGSRGLAYSALIPCQWGSLSIYPKPWQCLLTVIDLNNPMLLRKNVCDFRTKWVFHPSTVGGHSSKCFSSIKSIMYHTFVDIFFLWLEIY